jgi:hypothetical protein
LAPALALHDGCRSALDGQHASAYRAAAAQRPPSIKRVIEELSMSASDPEMPASAATPPLIEPTAAWLAAVELTFDAADLTGVQALRVRFASDRQRLAAMELGNAEPLPILIAPRSQEVSE